MKENGLAVNEGYIKSMDMEDLKLGLEEMFSMNEHPTALIASNDLSLFEVLRFAKEANFKIPADLAVVGIDEVPFASIFEPSLSIFSQPTFEMGNRAAELLLHKILNKDEEAEAKVHRFQPTLLAGKSH